MARIVPKLNLNKTPELVDNNSLIFAKNIRLNANGLSSDYGFDEIYNDIPLGYTIVGIIPYNTMFYILIDNGITSQIWQYNEIPTTSNPQLRQVPTAWKYSGGIIDGECSINLRGDILLTIAEAAEGVPIKTINITQHLDSNFDLSKINESFYTQAPEVPLYNLSLIEYYNNTIPAGTYQFFIRYEIYKDYYTDWFPASKELFAGYEKVLKTNQGGLKFIDLTLDSTNSFRFKVDKIYKPTTKFKSFQLGFIIAKDDEVYGRAYKHYSLDIDTIDFDYDTEYIEEIDTRDFLYPTYDLYNVGNVTEYKNKLYVSNYDETDFNPKGTDIDAFVEDIEVSFEHLDNTSIEQFSDETPISIEYVNNTPYIYEIDGDTVQDIIEDLLIDNQNAIFNTTTETQSQRVVNNHIEVQYYIGVVDETIVESEDPNEQTSIDEDYHILNESGETVTESTIQNVIAYLISRIEYVSGTTRHFRPEASPGANISYTIYHDVADNGTLHKCTISIRFWLVGDLQIEHSVQHTYTLVPYQKYNFYVHFVTNKGEITNGYPILNRSGEDPVEGFVIEEVTTSPNSAIYPVFTFGTALPSRFRACFISILHSENIVAQVFDIHNITEGLTIGDCLELDTMLYTGLKDLSFISGEVENTIDYRASYDNELYLTFGSSGKCVFQNKIDNATITNINRTGFIHIPYVANSEYAVLTKCTPWIIPDTEDVYDNYEDLNLLGYLCTVKKLADNLYKYYAGSDIYNKVTTTGQYGVSLNLTEVEANTVTNEYDDYRFHKDSTNYIVYSNFNLNYLILHNKPKEQIVSKGSSGNTKRYILLSLDSSTLSEVYELPSMYKTYTRRVYSIIEENTLTHFTNTIRSSVLAGDEAKVYMYKFLTTDYYNVPTDKGVIINLVAVGDNILVHTQDSMYKFSGQNSLTASGGEDVQMKESEVFDTGIQELFGSEFGYAGLANKKHQILSEFGYTFWDRDSGRIYLYTGNAQMKVLSDDITKLLRRANITELYLADDYYNNRIFVCIYFSDNKVATLSYDFVAKSFISVHDFEFNNHFKTKTKCYFIHSNNAIYKVGTSEGSYGPFITVNNGVYPKHNTEDCIVDVIYNDRFEIIKTLNTLQWVCNKIEGFDTKINMAEETFTVEPYEKRYKGDALRFYSDSCMTDKIDISSRSNDERLRDPLDFYNIKPKPNSYTKVRYNLGKWTFNYFRNILNRKENPVPPRPLAQEDTLIYGKYFVARFIFNRNINFKFEDVSFFISNEYNI